MAEVEPHDADLALSRHTVRLFSPIAPNYDRWSAVLSLGQDPRWRSEMVSRLNLPHGARVLDVAAGTGLITSLLERDGLSAVALDPASNMLVRARQRGAQAVLGTAEALPFPDATFDGLTFGYLLRYVRDPLDTMRELVRVVRPGGPIGMVEFGRPGGIWGPPWWLYTRIGLPVAGVMAGPGWSQVGRFLGPSIDVFHRRFPPATLDEIWEQAGLTDVRMAHRSLGGGLLMWGRRR
jgi:demethylmenaquinone methyltransferase / 2-methoxy-6-polyprenyl-1,4-benzoquinol methylase